VKIENLPAELKRRNVYKVAAAYAVVGWLLVQVATQVFPFFEIPNWAVRLVVLAIVIGFPVALVIAWAFELTPQGLKRTEDVDLATQGQRKSHAWIYVVIVGAALSIGLFFLGRYTAQHAGPSVAAIDKSIAVLPFANLSHDPENVYFAAGIQDEIITRLAKIADLKVISCTSTQRFKSSPDDIPAIAGQLGVANILEGSVQRTGDQVRVNVQLIKGTTDSHLWADTFDRKLTDIFAVESEIAKTIAGFHSSTEFDLSTLPLDVLQKGIEVGRTCIAKPYRNTQALLLLWKGLALYSMHQQKKYFFGCCSLSSQDPSEGGRVFEVLSDEGYIDPEFRVHVRPGFKCLWYKPTYPQRSVIGVTQVLRTYLGLGAGLCGPPAMVRQFRTIDYFVLLDLERLDRRIHYLLFGPTEESHDFAQSA
jgi:TolB-like protein